MDIQIESVLMAGMTSFALASMYFLWAYRKEFNSAFLVSFITLISYVVMFEGSLATSGAGGGEVHASRWLFYGLSCTLLVYEIAKFLGKSMREIIFLLYLTVIVMGAGALSAVYDGWLMLGMFAISSVAYVLLMYPLLTADSPHRGAVAKYILLGWTGFPVAFLLAPDGYGLIGAATAAMLYLAFDVFTKVIFYLDLHKKMQSESTH